MSELAVHPVAALFPMLADDELEELAADIKERGLLQPIVLDKDGRILDGRNRLAACEKAGIKPDFVTYADGDPDGYALAVNINRRHLKASARHLIAEMARRLTGKNYNNVVSKRDASRGGDVGLEIRLSEAAVVLDYAPDLVEKIFAGGMTLQQAAEIARPCKHEVLVFIPKLLL
jgi:ParB-like nuclease domain